MADPSSALCPTPHSWGALRSDSPASVFLPANLGHNHNPKKKSRTPPQLLLDMFGCYLASALTSHPCVITICLTFCGKRTDNLRCVTRMLAREYVCVCSVPQLCLFPNPMDCSPPGSSVHRIPQAQILEWVAISFFRVQMHFNLFLGANIKQVRAIRNHWSSDWISTFPDNWSHQVEYTVHFNPRALVIPFATCDTNR